MNTYEIKGTEYKALNESDAEVKPTVGHESGWRGTSLMIRTSIKQE